MEQLFFLVVSSAVGYIVHMVQKIDSRVDVIEKELAILSFRFPKRKADKDNFE